MSHIVLIRPGSTDFDEQNRIQGNLDLPLNARGEQQVRLLQRDLQTLGLEVIFTSPSEPAAGTAQQLGRALGIAVKELDGLRNFNQGLWQGLQVDELRRKSPKVFRQWQESPETICPPEGEELTLVIERVREALERPLKKRYSLAIVGSEPVLSIARCLILGQKLGELQPVTLPEAGGRWELLHRNADSPGGWQEVETVTSSPVGEIEREGHAG